MKRHWILRPCFETTPKNDAVVSTELRDLVDATRIPPAQLDSFEGLPVSHAPLLCIDIHTWINIRIYIYYIYILYYIYIYIIYILYIYYIDITTTWGITSTQPTGSSSLVRLWKWFLFGMTTFSLSTDVFLLIWWRCASSNHGHPLVMTNIWLLKMVIYSGISH